MAKPNKQLETLHLALIEYLVQRINTCYAVDEETGEMTLMPLPAAELAVMAKVLKDNGISADKDHADDLEKLQEALQRESDETNRKAIMQKAIDTLSADEGTMH